MSTNHPLFDLHLLGRELNARADAIVSSLVPETARLSIKREDVDCTNNPVFVLERGGGAKPPLGEFKTNQHLTQVGAFLVRHVESGRFVVGIPKGSNQHSSEELAAAGFVGIYENLQFEKFLTALNKPVITAQDQPTEAGEVRVMRDRASGSGIDFAAKVEAVPREDLQYRDTIINKSRTFLVLEDKESNDRGVYYGFVMTHPTPVGGHIGVHISDIPELLWKVDMTTLETEGR